MYRIVGNGYHTLNTNNFPVIIRKGHASYIISIIIRSLRYDHVLVTNPINEHLAIVCCHLHLPFVCLKHPQLYVQYRSTIKYTHIKIDVSYKHYCVYT